MSEAIPPGVFPIALDAGQQATHEIRTDWHDTAQTQKKCVYVVRTSDGKGDGPVVWFQPNGLVTSHGQSRDGVSTGAWRTYNTLGAHASTEVAHEDGSWTVTVFGDGARQREGLRRKDAAGVFRDDGWWTVWDASSGRVYQDLYALGSFLGRRPMLDALRPLLDGGEVTKALKELCGGNVNELFFGVEGLLAQGYALTLPVALELVQSAWEMLLPKCIPWVAAFGAEAIPSLEAKAAEVMADSGIRTNEVRWLSILLAQCHGGVLPEAHDALFNDALSFTERSQGNEEIVTLLRAVLAALPLARREGHVLSNTARNAWRHNTLLWTYADLAPTHAVCTRALALVEAFRKAEFTHAPARKLAVQASLDAFAVALPKHLTGFLETVGKKSAQRELVLRALADARTPEAAETLLAFADDALDDARRVAREGLEWLGDAAVPALEKAAAGKRSKTRTFAEETLAARKQAPAEAQRPSSASVDALAQLRASLTDEDRQTFAMTDAMQENSARLRANLLTDAPRALVVAADAAKSTLTGEKSVLMLHEWLWAMKTRLGTHPALPALLVEVLSAAPVKGSWRAEPLVTDAFEAPSEALLDALGWSFEQRLPEAALVFVKHLVAKHPGKALRALVAAACDARGPVRETAVQGLTHFGTEAATAVIPLLARKDDGALAAAAVLRAVPTEAAVGALEAALTAEKGKKRKEAFEEALAACRKPAGASGAAGATDHAALDAELAARGAKRKKKLPVVTLPAMHWRDGTALSDEAARGVFGALVDAEANDPNTELLAVRAQLRDEDCAAWQTAIEAAFPWLGEHRWKVYATPILGDDGQVRAMASQLQQWASMGLHALAGHAITALRRRNEGVSIAWVDHWADLGNGKLGREASEALEALCKAHGVDRDVLVDRATPKSSRDAAGVIEGVRRRLVLAMLTERAFSAEGFDDFVLGNPLVREAGAGAILRDATGALAVLTADGPTALSGEAVTLTAPVGIPHPCALDDATLDACRRALAARKITQPFKQIDRPFSRTPEADLKALEPRTLGFRPMMQKLEAAGYHAAPPEDAGVVHAWYRPLGGGWRITAHHRGYSVATRQGVDASVTEVTLSFARRDGGGTATPALLCEGLSDLRTFGW